MSSHYVPHTKVPALVFPTSRQAARHVALMIESLIRQNNSAGRATVLGLPTGSTPVGLYRELIRLRREAGPAAVPGDGAGHAVVAVVEDQAGGAADHGDRNGAPDGGEGALPDVDGVAAGAGDAQGAGGAGEAWTGPGRITRPRRRTAGPGRPR
jgi:hypothetical protein